MGNRAVITNKNKEIGVYLHWNGGRDSVEAFLAYCDLKGYRDLDYDEDYGFARLVQVISNYFGGSDSIGIGAYNHLDTDNGDNGVYIVDKWNIIDREFFGYEEQQEYDLFDMMCQINIAQPKDEQLPETKIQEYVNNKRGE